MPGTNASANHKIVMIVSFSVENKMTIAALILNYRNTELTLNCTKTLADSVSAIYIVDNSEDTAKSTELAEAFAKASSTLQVSPIILIPISNLGFSKGVNLGVSEIIKADKFKYIVLLNNDVKALSDDIVAMIQRLKRNENKAIVCPSHHIGFPPFRLYYNRWFGLITQVAMPGSFLYLTGACLAMPIDIAGKFPFDEEFFMYGEDIEFCARLASHGVKLETSNDYCTHFGTRSSKKGGFFYEYHVVRGHMILSRKLAKTLTDRILTCLGLTCVLPLRALIRMAKLGSTTPITALFTALWHEHNKIHPRIYHSPEKSNSHFRIK